MENKEEKQRDDPKAEIGGCRKRWLTTVLDQFGKDSVHTDLEYLQKFCSGHCCSFSSPSKHPPQKPEGWSYNNLSRY